MDIPASEKKILEKGEKLPLMEEFYTLQGEGYHSGKAAYFVRVGGCDVGCHWCDVKESWDANLHPLTATDNIVKNALQFPAKAVVITGGEPCIYNLEYLTRRLKENGIATFLETSGAYKISGVWDWICLSPKKTSPPRKESFVVANELKVIIHNTHDFEWAEQNAAFAHSTCMLFLQPEWSKAKQVMQHITDYVMRNPRWNISLQTHKYMNIP